MEIVTIGPAGQIELPDEVRDRYGLSASTPIRLVETRSGILLVLLGDGSMNPELAEELADWQTLGAESWDQFPFDDDGSPS